MRTLPTEMIRVLAPFAPLRLMKPGTETVRRTAWYDKKHPTFSDALAVVRKELWSREASFCESYRQTDTVKVPREFVERLTDAVCYAA